jgi:hypothetical protein
MSILAKFNELSKEEAQSAVFDILNSKAIDAIVSVENEVSERDMGKPGLNFDKIADKAAEEYGSEEAGKRVAGAVLKKILKK